MKRNVLIRDVDEDAYRRGKATAALRGVTLGRAVSDALADWAREAERPALEREVKADRAFVQSSWPKLEVHKGKAVVVASGGLRGVFQTYEEARSFSSRFKVALVFKVEETPSEREVEIGPELEI